MKFTLSRSPKGLNRIRTLSEVILCCCAVSWLLAGVCSPQTLKTGAAQSKGYCSPAVTGSNNDFRINCPGIGKEQGKKMVAILNKILENQLDPRVVIAKLDEILKAINPNIPVKVYHCDGRWTAIGPGANAAVEASGGGDDSAFRYMLTLNNSKDYTTLLKECTAHIGAEPGWLTPRLFCGIAYLFKGNRARAKQMLEEFDARRGPSYAQAPCPDIADFLRRNLQ